MVSINRTKGVFISFLLGGAVGSVIALLYAPKSGKHLRNEIGRKTNKLIEESRKKTMDSFKGVKERTESTLDSANDFLNTGMEKITRKTKKINDALESGLDTYNDERKSDVESNKEEKI
jgi:gas vesicle protein